MNIHRTSNYGRIDWRTLIGGALLPLMLAACGTMNGAAPVTDRRGADVPAQTSPQATATAPTVPSPSASTPPAVPTSKRGGGYYKDDGPGDSPPADLSTIPDAVPKAEPLHRFANNPYSVFGQDYRPQLVVGKYKARGIASWYGKRFHGQKTSTGETYDMYAMTAAHPTLPLPSYARVTNLANGKSVIVRVNDRGPFHTGRIIDLSWTAAAKLGYVNGGSGKVEVESLVPGEALPPVQMANSTDDAIARAGETATLPEIDDAKGAWLQLGAFGNRDNADAFKARLSREIDPDMVGKLVIRSTGNLFRVQLGPWVDAQEAHGIADRLAAVLDTRPVLVRK